MRRLLLLFVVMGVTVPAFAAFPTVAATATSIDTATSTSHVISLPTGITAGDLILVTHHGSATDATPNSAITGWTVVRERLYTSVVAHVVTLYRIADGSEGATVTLTTDLTENSAGCAYRIAGWHGTTPPEASAGVTGSSLAPDPDVVTPSWGAEDTMFIAVASGDGSAQDFTAYPANYTGSNITSPTHTATGGACAMATRNLNATSDDPGAFTDDSNVGWGAYTIAVRGTAIAAAVPRGMLLGVGP